MLRRPRREIGAEDFLQMRDNPFSLQGRTALVTGASSGLGQHFAQVLSRAGANVVLAARRLDRLQSLAAEIEARGRQGVGRGARCHRPRLGEARLRCGGGAGTGDDPGQQCRRAVRLVFHQDQRGGVARGAGRQPGRRVPRRPGGGAAHGGQWRRRLDHQHRLDPGLRRQQDAVGLCRVQGRGGQPHQVDGAGTGARQDPRQRAGARLLLHRDQRRVPGQRDRQAPAVAACR